MPNARCPHCGGGLRRIKGEATAPTYEEMQEAVEAMQDRRPWQRDGEPEPGPPWTQRLFYYA